MKQIDVRKELKHLYQPSAKEVSIVRVPKFNLLMVDEYTNTGWALTPNAHVLS